MLDVEVFDLQTCLIFKERNRLYLVFLSFILALKIVASYLYMGMIANSHHPWKDEKEV